MLAYIARRLASTVLVMGIVAVFVFLLLHLSPGDPAAIIAGDNATAEQIAGIRKQLGLAQEHHRRARHARDGRVLEHGESGTGLALPLQRTRWCSPPPCGEGLGVGVGT